MAIDDDRELVRVKTIEPFRNSGIKRVDPTKELHQHLITHSVPVAVVDLFESVDVHDVEMGDRQVSDVGEEPIAVRQSGQIVEVEFLLGHPKRHSLRFDEPYLRTSLLLTKQIDSVYDGKRQQYDFDDRTRLQGIVGDHRARKCSGILQRRDDRGQRKDGPTEEVESCGLVSPPEDHSGDADVHKGVDYERSVGDPNGN